MNLTNGTAAKSEEYRVDNEKEDQQVRIGEETTRKNVTELPAALIQSADNVAAGNETPSVTKVTKIEVPVTSEVKTNEPTLPPSAPPTEKKTIGTAILEDSGNKPKATKTYEPGSLVTSEKIGNTHKEAPTVATATPTVPIVAIPTKPADAQTTTRPAPPIGQPSPPVVQSPGPEVTPSTAQTLPPSIAAPVPLLHPVQAPVLGPTEQTKGTDHSTTTSFPVTVGNVTFTVPPIVPVNPEGAKGEGVFPPTTLPPVQEPSALPKEKEKPAVISVNGDATDIGDGIVVVTNVSQGTQTLAIDTSTSKLTQSKAFQPPQGWDSIGDVCLFGAAIFIPVVVVTIFQYLRRAVRHETHFSGKLREGCVVSYTILKSACLNMVRLRHTRGEDLENLGSEAALYLALHRETAVLILLLTCTACTVLLPIHLAAGKSMVNLEFTRSTIQHLGKHSPFLWVHTFFVFLVSLVYYKYLHNCRQHVKWSWKHGVIGSRTVDMWDSSVFVMSKLPEMFNDDRVKNMLEAIYPGEVSNVILIMDNSEATDLERKRHQVESEVATLRRFASRSSLLSSLGEESLSENRSKHSEVSNYHAEGNSHSSPEDVSSFQQSHVEEEEENLDDEFDDEMDSSEVMVDLVKRDQHFEHQKSFKTKKTGDSLSRELSLLDEKEAELTRIKKLEANLKEKHSGKCIVTFTSVELATRFADNLERRTAIRSAIENRLLRGDAHSAIQTLQATTVGNDEVECNEWDSDNAPDCSNLNDDDDGDDEGEGEDSDFSEPEQRHRFENEYSVVRSDDTIDDHILKSKDKRVSITRKASRPLTVEKADSSLLRRYSAAERAASAAVLQSEIEASNIKEWEVVPSPDPHDLIWEALHLDPKVYWIRTVLANIVIALVLFVVTTPTTILSLVSHLGSNTDGQDQYTSSTTDDDFVSSNVQSFVVSLMEEMKIYHPALASFLFVFLPQLIIVLVNNALMFTIYVIAKYWEPHHTYSAQETSVLHKTFWFLLFNTLLVPALAFKTLNSFVGDIISNDASPFSLLGQVFVVTSGAFTLTYVITQSLAGSAFQLMSLPSFLWRFAVEWLWPWATPEDRQQARDAKLIFDFGSEYATFLSLLSLIVMFSTTVPVILPFGLAYFFVKICVDQYQLNNVCGRDKSHSVPRCRIGRAAVRYLPIPLLLYQIGIIGYFSSYVCIANEILPVAAGRNPRGCSVVSPDDPDLAVPGTQVIRGNLAQLLLLYALFVYTAADCLYVFMVDSFNDQGMIVRVGFANQPFASDWEAEEFRFFFFLRNPSAILDMLKSRRFLHFLNITWSWIAVHVLGQIPVTQREDHSDSGSESSQSSLTRNSNVARINDLRKLSRRKKTSNDFEVNATAEDMNIDISSQGTSAPALS